MSSKGQKKKSKLKGIEVNSIYIFTNAFLNAFVAWLFFITKYPKLNKPQHISLQIILKLIVVTEIVVFVFSSLFIKEQCFNENKRFNSDSLRICFYCIFISIPLIFYLFEGELIKNFQKYFKTYANFSAIIIILLSIYFWGFYYSRCKKAITEIGGDNYLFILNVAKSVLTAVLIFLSAILFIGSFPDSTVTGLLPKKQNNNKLVYQVINLFVNAMYPFIDMYVYVRSEIDEFDKQEQEKREQQEKQKRKELEQEKQEQEKREQLIKEKRELLEREKH